MTSRLFKAQQLARQRGLDLALLTLEDYERLAIEARSLTELVVDGTRRYTAHGAVALGLTVLPAVRQSREETCRQCEHLVPLADGRVVCKACDCGGANLVAKWNTPWEACPLPEPRWRTADALTT